MLEKTTSILAIEDDAEIGGILQVRLGSEGYEVELADSGRSGLRQIGRAHV